MKNPIRPAKTRKGRYSEAQKKEIVGRYNELINAGTPATTAAKKVGVTYVTMTKWVGKKGRGPAKRGRKPGRAPRQVASSTTGNLALVTPGGYRIEGISADDLIRVLKALK